MVKKNLDILLSILLVITMFFTIASIKHAYNNYPMFRSYDLYKEEKSSYEAFRNFLINEELRNNKKIKFICHFRDNPLMYINYYYYLYPEINHWFIDDKQLNYNIFSREDLVILCRSNIPETLIKKDFGAHLYYILK